MLFRDLLKTQNVLKEENGPVAIPGCHMCVCVYTWPCKLCDCMFVCLYVCLCELCVTVCVSECFDLFGLGSTLDCAQVLLLALHTGNPPGRVWGTISDAEDETLTSHVQVTAVPFGLCVFVIMCIYV